MNLDRIRELAGINTTPSAKGKKLYESAPPGMENMVMKLKGEYPGDDSKAFATAWSIYNDKHGLKDESVTDSFTTDPEGDLTFDCDLTLDDLSDTSATCPSSDGNDAITAICDDLCSLGYTDDEVAEIIGSVSTELELGNCEDDTCDLAVSTDTTPPTIDESDDFDSGYDNSETMDFLDYFPNGSDGPVTGTKGPSGARYGDNPEHDGMTLSEGATPREVEIFIEHLPLRANERGETGDRLRDTVFRTAVVRKYVSEFDHPRGPEDSDMKNAIGRASGRYNRVKHHLADDPRITKLGREEGKNNGGRRPGGAPSGGLPDESDIDAKLAALELQKRKIQQAKDAAATSAQRSANDLFGTGENNQPELFETYKELVYNYRKHLEESEVLDPVKTPTLGVDREALKKPGGWTVMLLNDDYTPHEVVVEALMAATSMSKDAAFKVMNQANKNGWVPVRSYASLDMAETVADAIMRHAHSNTNYDHYRTHPHFRNYKGPWQLQADVLEAG